MRVLPILVLAAGCTGSSFSKDDSGATAIQLQQISYSVLSAAHASMPGTQPPVTVSLDQSVACVAGGSSTVSGDFASTVDATGTGSYSLDLMTTMTDCAIGNGVVINGAPYLATTGTLTFHGFALTSGVVTYSGAFTANADTCNVGLTVTLAEAGPAPRVTGTICGRAIELQQH
jgi:hypothetical protein